MPNIASVLKAEVTRLARRELKAQTDGLKKQLAAYRAEVASLRKRVAELERGAAKADLAAARSKPAQVATEAGDAAGAPGVRFRPDGMASNRKRLGLSAADFALLVGTTGQSIYAWESGKATPRGKFLAAIASLRGIGKREAAKRLAALR